MSRWPVSRCPATFLILGLVAMLAQLIQIPPAQADGARVALVIGNGDYGNDFGRLRNPTNDAKLIARSLAQLGFKVQLKTDVDQNEMKRAIRDFGAALRDAGSDVTGLFYYAGHGVQVEGVNYLLPIGAHIEREADVEIEAISADTVLKQMQFAENKINLVFLDACRNNPLTRGFRSASRGLARVDAPRGSFIGYSTAPGDVSVDGESTNSPYTTALAEELLRPGAAIEEVHRAVRLKVLQATGDRQTPWDSSSLTASVVLAPANAPAATVAASVVGADPEAEKVLWKSIETSDDPVVFEAYLRQFPNGIYAAHAAVRLAALRSGQASAPAVAEPAVTTPPVTTPPVTTPAATPAAAPVPVATPAVSSTLATSNTRHIALQNANIRAQPNTQARIVGKLRRGETITVTGQNQDGSWLQVALATGDGFVSASLLEARPDPIPAAITATPPAPPASPVATKRTLRVSANLRADIERFLANSETLKTHFRFLAINGAGDRIGQSTNCKIKKSGWGGFSAEGGCTENSARRAAVNACREADCRIIYEGTRQIGDFEIEWVGAEEQMETMAPNPDEVTPPAAPAIPAAVPAPAEPTITASAATTTSGISSDGNILRLASALRPEIERFLANSATIKGNYRFLAVNGTGDKVGQSTNCRIKKSGWGGFAAEGGCTEDSARRAAISSCGDSDCRIIFEGTEKIGRFEIAWE